MQNLYHLIERSWTLHDIYNYGTVNSIFVDIADSTNINNGCRTYVLFGKSQNMHHMKRVELIDHVNLKQLYDVHAL